MAATSTQSNMFLDAEAFVSRFLCRDSKSGPASTCAPRPPPSPLTDASFYDAVSACTLEAPVSGECITYGFSTTNFGTMPNWDVQYVTDMSYSFKNEPVFDGDISSWNTSSVTSMREMFHFATSFNRAIGGWNTSSVTTMYSTFANAQSFNQPLRYWDTSRVARAEKMFSGASSFARRLYLPSSAIQTGIFSGCVAFHEKYSCSTENDGPADSCEFKFKVEQANFQTAVNSCLNEEPLKGDCTTYGTVTTKYGVMSEWDVSSVTDMQSAFSSKTTFNGDISNWDVRFVKDMSHMFYSANSFTQDLSSWQTSSLTRMYRLLHGGNSNPDLSNWDVFERSKYGSCF